DVSIINLHLQLGRNLYNKLQARTLLWTREGGGGTETFCLHAPTGLMKDHEKDEVEKQK
ncbi:hypothetical protein NHX12_027413, partial [Muraenolepis orangiensis]